MLAHTQWFGSVLARWMSTGLNKLQKLHPTNWCKVCFFWKAHSTRAATLRGTAPALIDSWHKLLVLPSFFFVFFLNQNVVCGCAIVDPPLQFSFNCVTSCAVNGRYSSDNSPKSKLSTCRNGL